MTIDPVALRGTLAHIEAHPETWHQWQWAKRNCRTSYCFAGWACVLSGIDEFKWEGQTALELDDGNPIRETAAMILGLEPSQASSLFCGSNTLQDLRRQVAKLCHEAEVSA